MRRPVGTGFMHYTHILNSIATYAYDVNDVVDLYTPIECLNFYRTVNRNEEMHP